jgi:hypothetical protein
MILGKLVSDKKPTMTRQLNVLSNIVQGALLFGGDQKLLVLAETLDANKSAFIHRWYPVSTTTSIEKYFFSFWKKRKHLCLVIYQWSSENVLVVVFYGKLPWKE